jgi:nucleotide-binding universal stress UspA family protein
MLKDILVCLEGSASGLRAAEVAIEVGQALTANLVGLAIVDEPDIRAWEPTGIGGASYKRQRDDALLAEAQVRAQEWLAGFEARCAAAGVPMRALELRGRPAETILEEIQRHDLTLLGRDANFRFETEDDDKKTRDTILRRAGRPLMVVPEGERPTGTAVLVAYDGSTAARRALVGFAESGLAVGRGVHVAAVDDDGATAWEAATRGARILGDLGVAATVHNLVPPGSVAEALLELREKLDAGLMVLGAYTRSRLARMFWGSVTEEIVGKTVVPLFLHY